MADEIVRLRRTRCGVVVLRCAEGYGWRYVTDATHGGTFNLGFPPTMRLTSSRVFFAGQEALFVLGRIQQRGFLFDNGWCFCFPQSMNVQKEPFQTEGYFALVVGERRPTPRGLRTAIERPAFDAIFPYPEFRGFAVRIDKEESMTQ